MKLHIDIKGVLPNLENGKRAEDALNNLPGNANEKAHAEVSTKFYASRDLPINTDRIVCRDSIIAELDTEEIDAYEMTAHNCDHDEKDRRKTKGCGGFEILASKGEMPVEDI